MELYIFSPIHLHGADRDKLEMLIRGDRLHMGVSEESANKKYLPLAVHMCCASKGSMILMLAVSLVLEQCALFTWSDGQCIAT
jgi:hypothetical protein